MIARNLSSMIPKRLNSKKAIILIGPRQTGKTTLMKEIALSSDQQFLYWNCDDPATREKLTAITTDELKKIIGSCRTIVLDHIQRIENVNNTLRILTDQADTIQLFTASSAIFESSVETSEPLTDHTQEFTLYPVSWEEFEEFTGIEESKSQLEMRVIYGMLPEVITNPGKEKEVLQKLMDNFIRKDILSHTSIRKRALIEKLLQILALHLGEERSLNELSDLVRVDKNTINKYIGLMERDLIIFKLQPLSQAHHSEIKNGRRIFFYDTGIRNAIISNFSSLNLRQDANALWENYCISERIKFLYYHQRICNRFFWRTTSRKEVDYIEEYDGEFHAYAFSWNRKEKKIFSKTFLNAYPGVSSDIITPSNFSKFLTSAKVKL